MTDPSTKAELLDRARDAREAFTLLVGSLDDVQMLAPGVQGDWSAKDLVAHVTAWEEWLLGLLEQVARGESLSPRAGSNGTVRNEAVYAERRDLPLSTVMADYARAGEVLMEAIEGFSDEQLFTPGRYDGRGADGLARLIAHPTYRHYASHGRAIRTWLAQSSDDPQVFYAWQGPVTHPHRWWRLLEGLPGDIPGLVQVLQGLVLHPYWAAAYGVTLSEERQQEPNLRFVARQLERMRALDPRPLTEPRDLEHRLVGNCRDHAVLLAAMLRHQNVPSRARCGFGAYFTPGHYEDHWATEYWHADEQRWVLVDGQLDALQRERLKIGFDPLDVPRDQFIVAGQAWQMCRTGGADPDAFGIFDMHGLGFVLGNVVRDVLALNKIEILPWDWGFGYLTDELPADLAPVDHAAALTLSGDAAFTSLRALVHDDEHFHVPAEWLAP